MRRIQPGALIRLVRTHWMHLSVARLLDSRLCRCICNERIAFIGLYTRTECPQTHKSMHQRDADTSREIKALTELSQSLPCWVLWIWVLPYVMNRAVKILRVKFATSPHWEILRIRNYERERWNNRVVCTHYGILYATCVRIREINSKISKLF